MMPDSNHQEATSTTCSESLVSTVDIKNGTGSRFLPPTVPPFSSIQHAVSPTSQDARHKCRKTIYEQGSTQLSLASPPTRVAVTLIEPNALPTSPSPSTWNCRSASIDPRHVEVIASPQHTGNTVTDILNQPTSPMTYSCISCQPKSSYYNADVHQPTHKMTPLSIASPGRSHNFNHRNGVMTSSSTPTSGQTERLAFNESPDETFQELMLLDVERPLALGVTSRQESLVDNDSSIAYGYCSLRSCVGEVVGGTAEEHQNSNNNAVGRRSISCNCSNSPSRFPPFPSTAEGVTESVSNFNGGLIQATISLASPQHHLESHTSANRVDGEQIALTTTISQEGFEKRNPNHCHRNLSSSTDTILGSTRRTLFADECEVIPEDVPLTKHHTDKETSQIQPPSDLLTPMSTATSVVECVNKSNWFFSLPLDVLRHSVLEFLDIRDTYRLALSCSSLYQYINGKYDRDEILLNLKRTEGKLHSKLLPSESLLPGALDQECSGDPLHYSWSIWNYENDDNGGEPLVLSPTQFFNRHPTFFDPLSPRDSFPTTDGNNLKSDNKNDAAKQKANDRQSAEELNQNQLCQEFSSYWPHLTLGLWWNKLTPSMDTRLTVLLSQCRLTTIKVEPEFYNCLCPACIRVRTNSVGPNSVGPNDQHQLSAYTPPQAPFAYTQRSEVSHDSSDDSAFPIHSSLMDYESDRFHTTTDGSTGGSPTPETSPSGHYHRGGAYVYPYRPHRPSDPTVLPSPLLLSRAAESPFVEFHSLSPFSLRSPSEIQSSQTDGDYAAGSTASPFRDDSSSPHSEGPVSRTRPLMTAGPTRYTRQASNSRNHVSYHDSNSAPNSLLRTPVSLSWRHSVDRVHVHGQTPRSDDGYPALLSPVRRITHAGREGSFTFYNSIPSNVESDVENDTNNLSPQEPRLMGVYQSPEFRPDRQQPEWGHDVGVMPASNSPLRQSTKDENIDDLVVAKRHSTARFFWVLRLMLLSRASLQSIDFGTPDIREQTICDESATLPEFPTSFRTLKQRFIFPELNRLRFGYTIDCRFIVPIVDFCNYPKLTELEILGLKLRYELGSPQFGIKPTMIFGPQQMFINDETHQPPQQLWLPALYNGGADETLQLQGRGIYVSREYHYEGNFKDGRNDGLGKMTSKCGEAYEGEWKDGRRHGRGVVIQSDGKRLEGEWVKDVLHGRGVMELADGLRYEGAWVRGALEGWGILSKRGRLLAVGQFLDGRPHGWMACRTEYLFEQTEPLHSSCDFSAGETPSANSPNAYEKDAEPEFKTFRQSDFESDETTRNEIEFEQVSGLSEQSVKLEPYGRRVQAMHTESQNDDAFVPIEDVVCELDTLDVIDVSYSATRPTKGGILKQRHSSFLEILNNRKGWKSHWNFHHNETNSLLVSRIAAYQEAFQLLKHPPTVDDVFLLNSKLLHQAPGLLQHSERSAVEREQRHLRRMDCKSPPDCPSWVEEILSRLNSDPVIHREEELPKEIS